jgi:hypothetical protein
MDESPSSLFKIFIDFLEGYWILLSLFLFAIKLRTDGLFVNVLQDNVLLLFSPVSEGF